MPYITQEARKELCNRQPENAGELNYIITTICNIYRCAGDTNYQRYNDIIGALEGAKLEMYRRRIAPYEDIKRHENGDVS